MSVGSEKSGGSIHDALVQRVAGRLRTAYEQFVPIAPVRDEIVDIDTAYAVQQANTDHWCQAGRRIVGRKIGLTSLAVQRQLGVDQPDFGVLFDTMLLEDSQAVAYRDVLQPKAEAEVAIVLGREIDDAEVDLRSLAAAIDHLLPAIEVVGSRIENWDISIVDTIADNASSGMFVVGSVPVNPRSVELSEVKMSMDVDGGPASSGSGAACLGHPYNAALWLARRLVLHGCPLQAGDIVLTGALGPMVELRGGSTVVATIEGLGSVSTSRDSG